MDDRHYEERDTKSRGPRSKGTKKKTPRLMWIYYVSYVLAFQALVPSGG